MSVQTLEFQSRKLFVWDKENVFFWLDYVPLPPLSAQVDIDTIYMINQSGLPPQSLHIVSNQKLDGGKAWE